MLGTWGIYSRRGSFALPLLGTQWPVWYLLALGGFVAVIAVLAVYDVRNHRIPNVVTYPAIAAGLLLAVVNPVGPWYDFVLGGLIGGGILLAITLASGGAMGMGDVKLGVVVGLVSGWPGVLVALFAAFASGAIVGVLLLAARRIGRRQPVPFAPALLAGTLVALFVGPQLVGLVVGRGF
jgi:prepilin signal peptidase PulO-like enzyme (type II secretory pathway)